MLSGVGAKARLVRGLAPRHFVFPGTFYLKDLFLCWLSAVLAHKWKTARGIAK